MAAPGAPMYNAPPLLTSGAIVYRAVMIGFGNRIGGAVAVLLAVATCSGWAVEVEEPVPASPAPAIAELPSPECVRLSRAARLAGERGEYQAAIALLEQAVEGCPQAVDPILARLRLHRLLGNEEEAAEDLRALRRRVAEQSGPLQLPALIRLIGDRSSSREELAAVLDRLADAADPEASPRHLRALAVVQAHLGELDAAHSTLTRLIAEDGSPDLRWAALALDVHLQRWDGAVAQLEALVDEDPWFGEDARLRLVGAYARAGRDGDALLLAQRLVERRGEQLSMIRQNDLVKALLDAAWAQQDRDHREEARRLFELAVEADGGKGEADGGHGEAADVLELLYATPEERIAASRRREGQLLESADPFTLLQEGTERLGAGDAEGAIALLRRATAELPEEAAGWYNLGLAASSLDLWEESATAFRRVAELAPDDTSARFRLGVCLSNLRLCDEAVPVLRQVVLDDPALSQAHYYLYQCYQHTGDAEAAQEALARYQEGSG